MATSMFVGLLLAAASAAFAAEPNQLGAVPGAIVVAQAAPPAQRPAAQPQTQPQTQAQPQAPKRQPRPAQPAPAAPSGDAVLRQRIEQLEEQLVDIQVVLGTLQSLAQGQRASPAPFSGATSGLQQGGGSGDGPRIDVIETQIRALSQQIERLQGDVRAIGGRRSEAPAQERAPVVGAAPRGPSVAGGFGTTQVVPAERDPIGGLLLGAAGTEPATTAPPVRTSLPATQSAKDAYELAYGYLLQQNYGAAEAAFADFLEQHPRHALAGNAQYWLGETFFVRGDYKSAASAFLKGFQSYAQSAKAPESLLKLAISLDRLGERDSACSTFSELNSRFPRAPQHVLAKAETERRRAGC